MIASARYAMDCERSAGYDRQIHLGAAAALATSKYAPLRSLNCQVSQGVVKLSGRVPSFYLKALAQAAVLQLYPDSIIDNSVEVTGEPAVLVARSCASR